MNRGDITSSRRIESGKATHRGKVRLQNEDAAMVFEYHVCHEPEDMFTGIYAVADGVGGNDDGEVASRLALSTLSEHLVKALIFPDDHQVNLSLEDDLPTKFLTQAVDAANYAVCEYGRKNNNGAGTTLTAMLVYGPTVYIANAGDSRLYQLRDSQLHQVTTDHSLVAEMVSAGKLKKDEIYTHPHRNIITRCLGMCQESTVDVFTCVLKPGDSFLICSDGLWEMVRNEKICEILTQSPTAQAACNRLIEEANLNGGLDNVTAVVIKINDWRVLI